ncbi:MAG: tetratricopeptide repeat protein [Gammaproteobacteria bacterium]|nr:tetratricopeptide repeat protein [Gammaproteobacteria bacterium]
MNSLLGEGLALHERGDLRGAALIYEEILSANADFAPAYHLLGTLSAQRGDVRRALDLLERSVTLDATVPEAQLDLGNVYRLLDRPHDAASAYRNALGTDADNRLAMHGLAEVLVDIEQEGVGGADEALALYQRLVELEPRDAQAHFQLGNMHANRQRHEAAIAAFRAALNIDAALPEAHHNLAVAIQSCALDDENTDAREAGLIEAKQHYERALGLREDYLDAHFNFGQLYEALGRPAEARPHYERALDLFPEFLLARRSLGQLLLNNGEAHEAYKHFDHIAQSVPEEASAHYDLGVTLERLERPDDAALCYERALRCDPRHAASQSNLGTLCVRGGELERGAQMLEAALAAGPEQFETWSNLGAVRQMQADLEAATSCYDNALRVHRDAIEPRQNRLSLSNYRADISAKEVFDLHTEFGQRISALRASNVDVRIGSSGARESGRTLRIGYVSPDFRTHSVAFFIEPILRAHDRGRFEVYGFANVRNPDATTERLRSLATRWFDISAMSDAEVAALIASNEIDILVDLAGHSIDNRLAVFADKPAPVQVTYLGYPNTTGLPQMDYRLVDNVTDPSPTADVLCTEEVVRLPDVFITYQAPAAQAPATSADADEQPFTFVSFNELLKMNRQVVEAWARILREAPQSRLLLKGTALGDEATCARIVQRFAEFGVSEDRLWLLGRTESLADHLALYGHAHLALDTFPYNGTTTTCEALWMGVPVLTWEGDRHAARVSASLLKAIGAQELVQADLEDYIAAAVRFAQQPSDLIDLRADLRGRMERSSLMDAQTFTHNLERAYETMWARHQQRHTS